MRGVKTEGMEISKVCARKFLEEFLSKPMSDEVAESEEVKEATYGVADKISDVIGEKKEK